jgi:hypothetical protein
MPLIPPADLRSARLLEVVAYLESKRSDGWPPSRQRLDPVPEAPLLTPYLALIERHPSQRHRIRLLGSRVVEMSGKDYTGYWTDEIDPVVRGDWWAQPLDAVFSSDRIVAGWDQAPCESRAYIVFEWLGLRLMSPPEGPAFAILAVDVAPRLQGR